MAFQAAPPTNANIQNQNLAQNWAGKGVSPPVFIRTFQAAPLPLAVNNQTIGHPIG